MQGKKDKIRTNLRPVSQDSLRINALKESVVVCRIPVGIMSLLALKCTRAVIAAAASHVADGAEQGERACELYSLRVNPKEGRLSDKISGKRKHGPVKIRIADLRSNYLEQNSSNIKASWPD